VTADLDSRALGLTRTGRGELQELGIEIGES
jgi:hypothetical protein